MTVINNLVKLCTWRKTVLLALKSTTKNIHIIRQFKTENSSEKHKTLNVKVHNYVVQKADPNQILKYTEILREILKKKGRLSAVDMDLCSKISTSTINEILIQLHSFILLDTSYCLNSLFYKVFKEYLKKGPLERLKWDQLIQIIFYISHHKDNETNTLMVKCLHQVKKCPEILTSDYRDLCVIMEATFVEGTFISQENILKRVKQILRDEIFYLVEDPIWLGMICKGLRSSQFNDKATLVELAENLKKSPLVEHFSLMSVSSIVSLYASALIKDQILLDIFTRAAARDARNFLDKRYLNKSRSFVRPARMKDLGRFLFTSTRLNHQIEKSLMDKVFVPMFERLKRDNRKKDHELDIHYEIVCLTSFWFMGYDLSKIESICQEIAEAVPHSHFRQRDYQRCAQLLEILDLAYPKLLTPYLHKIKTNVMQKASKLSSSLLEKRGNLVYLQKMIDKFKKDLNVSRCYIENIVPSFFIEGVTVEIEGKKIHIDVLEIQFCLLDSEEPNGIMVSKIKIMGFVPGISQHIVIPNSEVVKLSRLQDAEAINYLKQILKCSKKVKDVYYWEI